MNRGRSVAVLACCLLVFVVGAVGVAQDVSGQDGSLAFAQEDVDPDDVLMSVAVAEDGDAEWTIEYRVWLETDEDRAAFEELQADIESDPDPYVEEFEQRMNSTATAAAEDTGREMTIGGMTVSADREELPRERGVVTYTFRWSNFAAVDGDRLVVGDAIDGLYLEADTALEVRWVESRELVAAAPDPDATDERSITWRGQTNFASGEPRVELAPPGPTDDVSLRSLAVAVTLVVLLAVAVAGAFVASRRGTFGTATDDPPDDDLLSNEERVLRLLERNGGRMKQQAVAETLGWTAAKTSQVTKKLRDSGELEGFRLGRENVLALSEADDGDDEDDAGT